MGNGSVNALHVALAAAVTGWLVFSLSHAVAVWKRRSEASAGRRSYGMLFAATLLCVAGLVAGWLNRELTRRAGVIAGTDFFVVRAHTAATAHLNEVDTLAAGSPLVTYDSPDTDRAAQRLQNQIAVLDGQARIKALQPLTIDPEVLRLAQEQSDNQRARLSQLGFGLSTEQGAAHDPQMLASQRAKSQAAALELERTQSLVQDGILPRQKLDEVASVAASAAQELLERQRLIDDAAAGSATLLGSRHAILNDGKRAGAERAAELAELVARSTEMHDDLLQLKAQQSVQAPFGGTVVYRHPSPALASPGQVILALARDAGFVATVQVPAREASMLHPGQVLPLKLQHSLVSEEIKGRLVSTQPVADVDGRADLLIACKLPREQFEAFAAGSVPVTLLWRPALYTDSFARSGFGLAALLALIWLCLQVRVACRARMAEPASDEVDRVLALLDNTVPGAAR